MKKINSKHLKQLQYFCEIVNQGGVSNATESTGLTQPALSNMLIDLERELGVTLCLRGRGGFELTHEGRLVYQQAIELDNTLVDYASKLQGIRTSLSGQVRIGCLNDTVSFNQSPLIRTIQQFYALSDDVEVQLTIQDYKELKRLFEDKLIDMFIATIPETDSYDANALTPLDRETSYLYARQDLAEQLKDRHYDFTDIRINDCNLPVHRIYSLLDISSQSGAHIVNRSNLESALITTLAGTHVSFLPDHLVEQTRFEHELVALKPEQWYFVDQFFAISHPTQLGTAALEFKKILTQESEIKNKTLAI